MGNPQGFGLKFHKSVSLSALISYSDIQLELLITNINEHLIENK